MARFNFCVTQIATDLQEQSVYVTCSADVDHDSANEDSIYLMKRRADGHGKDAVPVDITIDGKEIRLHLKEWALPNDEYILIVQNNICGVVDDPSYKLETSLLRNVVFDSAVTSEVRIISPISFTEVDSSVSVSWKEAGKTTEGTFYVETATENAFYNIVRRTLISKEQAKACLKDGIYSLAYGEILNPGQYYIRIRAQRSINGEKDGDYGKWSEIVTFIVKGDKTTPSKPPAADPEPKPAPEKKSDLPEIEDLTEGTGKSGTSAAENTIVPEYMKSIPEAFLIAILQPVDISAASVKLLKQDFDSEDEETIESKLSLSSDGKDLVVVPSTISSNAIYKITISGLKSTDGFPINDIVKQYQTPFTPMHASLREMKPLQKQYAISDDDMRQHIYEASIEADFIQTSSSTMDSDTVAFAKKQYAKTRVTYDILLDNFMTRMSSGGGATYTLDTATYEDSLNSTAYKGLLDKLKDELSKWSDAIRGYTNPGRAKPKATRIGVKSDQNQDVSWTTTDSIIQQIDRNIPQWTK